MNIHMIQFYASTYDNIAATDHDGFLALDLDAGGFQEGDDALGGARQEERLTGTFGHVANVDSVETIHILLIINCFHNSGFINVRRQRHLDKDTVHAVIVVQLLDLLKQFELRDRLGQLLERKLDTSLLYTLIVRSSLFRLSPIPH